ncbi:MAG TPA: hypothetical protein VMU11_00130 [Verrucomicrobiae bacterium]|nr:hypothetical protein [Verrucomicrobiae bacterium]
MARRFALFALMLSGCLRPVWTEPPHSTPAPVASATPTRAEQRELFVTPYDDEDRYQIAFEDQIARSSRIYLYITVRDYFAMDCRWQGTTCTGYLPREARGARVLLIQDKYRRCPTFRLMREEVPLQIAEQFHWGCGFVLEAPP